jgi:hypothetical protein
VSSLSRSITFLFALSWINGILSKHYIRHLGVAIGVDGCVSQTTERGRDRQLMGRVSADAMRRGWDLFLDLFFNAFKVTWDRKRLPALKCHSTLPAPF